MAVDLALVVAGEPSVDVTIELNEEGTLKVTARDKTPGSAGCTETRSVAKDRRRLRDAEIAAMNARVVASSHAFARLRDTLLAKDNVLATLARGRMLHSELTTEAPGKPRPVITPALTALKTVRCTDHHHPRSSPPFESEPMRCRCGLAWFFG